jgi:hypothetical protein
MKALKASTRSREEHVILLVYVTDAHNDLEMPHKKSTRV